MVKEYVQKCSFCGKTVNEVNRLIMGNGCAICDECALIAYATVSEYERELEKEELKTIPKPSDIKAFLDQYVIGQDEAKIALSVAVYNHYKRINNKKSKDIEIQKSNILMLGASGTGKTELARTIAKMLKVPFAIADATTLTEAGYVGDDVENILLRLIENADFDVERAEKGIIYIDEIDKISRKSESPSITRDVNGEGVQHALLKIIEGTVARVPPMGGRKHPQSDCIEIDTSNILFICGGAFDGIEQILRKKQTKEKSIGFGAEPISKKDVEMSDLLKTIEPQDVIKYGLVPELVGRLPIITTLKPLDKNTLRRILTEPKNSIIKQYQRLFEIDNVTLEFEDEALDCIVEKAINRNVGARGLRAILEEVMQPIMFSIPDVSVAKKVVITKAVITNKAEPLVYDVNNPPLKWRACESLY